MIDLDELVKIAQAGSFEHERLSPKEVRVTVGSELVLSFVNLPEEDDTLIGFLGCPWHYHDELCLQVDQETYQNFGPEEVLPALKDGSLLVVESWLGGKLRDRWLTHRRQAIDVLYLDPNEELRVRSCAGVG